ncbi:MAG: hypothetical protein AAF236_11720 [Verrucomicrobiota bacterium]
MRSFFPINGSAVLGLVALAFSLAGCTTPQGNGSVMITKVNPYHLSPGNYVSSEDPMIVHEYRSKLRGAIDGDDYRDRYGYYFSVFWKSETRAPATVRLDYRLAKTGPRIHTLETDVGAPEKKNVTKFEVVGEEYAIDGTVTQWRVTILEGGVEVAEYKSFLWK